MYAASRSLLLGGFISLENKEARTQLARAQAALTDELSALDAFDEDNSAWDAAYNDMAHPAPSFLDSIFREGARGTLALQRDNYLLLIDPSAKVVAYKAFDFTANQPTT